MDFVFKYNGAEHRLALPFETTRLDVVGAHLSERTNTHFSTQKLLGPGLKGLLKLAEWPDATLAEAGVVAGKRYTLLGSAEAAVQSVQCSRELRQVRTVEQEEQREAQRRRIAPSALTPPDGEFSFGRYEVLDDAVVYPSPSTARKLLYRLANDPGIRGVMKKYRWKVGLLSEMPPEGKVGISARCVLGYNVNKGQEISLRLRTDDRKGFRKYLSVRETLIHELTHMVWSEHDEDFKKLNSQLLRECAEFVQRHQGFRLVEDVAQAEAEEQEAPSFEGRRLGGALSKKSATAAAREAAIKRHGGAV